MEMQEIETDYLYSDDVYLDDNIWCICNTTLPLLYRLILYFSYLYDKCGECCRYKIVDIIDMLENKDILLKIKNIIKKNLKILQIKFMDMTPLEFINRLYKILDIETTQPYLKHRVYAQIRANQHYLYKIEKYINIEHPKYLLEKNFAFIYIKNSNHIGNNAMLLQLPLEMWEYIFTFF